MMDTNLFSDELTSTVVARLDEGWSDPLPCTPGALLVVALLPRRDGVGSTLTLTHVASGMNVGGVGFPPAVEYFTAVCQFRDELLALDVDWASTLPDVSGCRLSLRKILNHVREAADWAWDVHEVRG